MVENGEHLPHSIFEHHAELDKVLTVPSELEHYILPSSIECSQKSIDPGTSRGVFSICVTVVISIPILQH